MYNFSSFISTTTLLTLQNFILYFIFFHSNRSVQKCDLFLFNILNTKLQTHFLGRYAEQNQIQHSRVRPHAIRVNESFAFLTLTVDNYQLLECPLYKTRFFIQSTQITLPAVVKINCFS
jgi:hypothetical protein